MRRQIPRFFNAHSPHKSIHNACHKTIACASCVDHVCFEERHVYKLAVLIAIRAVFTATQIDCVYPPLRDFWHASRADCSPNTFTPDRISASYSFGFIQRIFLILSFAIAVFFAETVSRKTGTVTFAIKNQDNLEYSCP